MNKKDGNELQGVSGFHSGRGEYAIALKTEASLHYLCMGELRANLRKKFPEAVITYFYGVPLPVVYVECENVEFKRFQEFLRDFSYSGVRLVFISR